MTEPIKKKRGRKPKSTYIQNKINTDIHIDDTKSDEENIILHLPITINDINPLKESFIEKESIKNILYDSQDSKTIKVVENPKLLNIENVNIKNININKIIIHDINTNINTKCWWCHNIFITPAIQLPDDYYNNTFFCSGHFCSYNCAKSYNLNINDQLTWKRCSLLNLLYYQTYMEYKEITPAPSWLILQEYGGKLTIDEFRNNFVYNTKEYTVLHPPLISRQMQIEESYRINETKHVSINNLNRLYMDNDIDLQLKRTKPIMNTLMNLENTMGLMKVSKKK